MNKKPKSFETFLRIRYGSKTIVKIKATKPSTKFALFCYENFILPESSETAIIELMKLREDMFNYKVIDKNIIK